MSQYIPIWPVECIIEQNYTQESVWWLFFMWKKLCILKQTKKECVCITWSDGISSKRPDGNDIYNRKNLEQFKNIPELKHQPIGKVDAIPAFSSMATNWSFRSKETF